MLTASVVPRLTRVSDAGVRHAPGNPGPPRRLSRRAAGRRAAGRRARQVLRDELPVIPDPAGADDAVVLDQLQVARVVRVAQAHLVSVRAQRAELAVVDHLDEEPRELGLPVGASPHGLLGRGQLGVEAPAGPRREAAGTVHRGGPPRNRRHGRQHDPAWSCSLELGFNRR